MEELFNSIRESYNSLWHVKILGESLEIVTPMVTTNENFVSVFITKRGDDFVVTDGGWISAGYYECDLDTLGTIYKKLLQYYIDNYGIKQTQGHGRTFYYKKEREKSMVVNAVFELSNFISAVVSGSNIPFQAGNKDVRFRKTVKEYLQTNFAEDVFQFNYRVKENSSIEYGAVSRFCGSLQLMNFVTGSDAAYYRDSLCRSNFYFDAVRCDVKDYNINKTIALLDDTHPKVYETATVKEMITLSNNRGNILIPWSERERLKEELCVA